MESKQVMDDAQWVLSTTKNLINVKNVFDSECKSRNERTIYEHLNLPKTTVREMVTESLETGSVVANERKDGRVTDDVSTRALRLCS